MQQEAPSTSDPKEATNRLELYVRALAPDGYHANQEYVLDQYGPDRMAHLKDNGRIDEYAVEVWGDHHPDATVVRTNTAKRLRDRITSFHRWADGYGMHRLRCGAGCCLEKEAVACREHAV